MDKKNIDYPISTCIVYKCIQWLRVVQTDKNNTEKLCEEWKEKEDLDFWRITKEDYSFFEQSERAYCPEFWDGPRSIGLARVRSNGLEEVRYDRNRSLYMKLETPESFFFNTIEKEDHDVMVFHESFRPQKDRLFWNSIKELELNVKDLSLMNDSKSTITSWHPSDFKISKAVNTNSGAKRNKKSSSKRNNLDRQNDNQNADICVEEEKHSSAQLVTKNLSSTKNSKISYEFVSVYLIYLIFIQNGKFDENSNTDELSSLSNIKGRKRLKRGTTSKYLSENSAEYILYNTVNGYLLRFIAKNGPKTYEQIFNEVSVKYKFLRKLSGYWYTGSIEKTIKGALSSNGLFLKANGKQWQWSQIELWICPIVELWNVEQDKAKEYIQEKLCQIEESQLKKSPQSKHKRVKTGNQIEKDVSLEEQNSKENIEKYRIVYDKLEHASDQLCLISGGKDSKRNLKAIEKAANERQSKLKVDDLSWQLKSFMQVYSHFRNLLKKSEVAYENNPISKSINSLNEHLEKLTKSIETHIQES